MSKKSKKTTKTTKKINQINLPLSKTELLHLRDLMSIVLPPDGSKTVSKDLSMKENRSLQENKLFEKIYNLCEENNLPVGDSAPDYFVNINFMPEMEVALLNYPDEVEDKDYEEQEQEV